MRQWWALERTTVGLKADPGGAPVFTAPFSELTSKPDAMSWAEKTRLRFWTEKGSMVSVYGPER